MWKQRRVFRSTEQRSRCISWQSLSHKSMATDGSTTSTAIGNAYPSVHIKLCGFCLPRWPCCGFWNLAWTSDKDFKKMTLITESNGIFRQRCLPVHVVQPPSSYIDLKFWHLGIRMGEGYKEVWEGGCLRNGSEVPGRVSLRSIPHLRSVVNQVVSPYLVWSWYLPLVWKWPFTRYCICDLFDLGDLGS